MAASDNVLPPTQGRPNLPDPGTRVDIERRRVTGVLTGFRARRDLAQVERVLLFLGYPRTGHSLVGSLLNAHPEMVIAHELNVFQYVARRFGRRALFGLLLERDRAFGALGRQWTDYDYAVPNQYQGRFERLRVIGDKGGHAMTVWVGRDPALLDRLRCTVRLPLRVLHVTRNPYDIVATMARRSRSPINGTIGRFTRLCQSADEVRRRLAPDEVLHVDYERVLVAARRELAAMCAFLEVEAGPGYLDDCAGIVWTSGSRSRQGVEWTAEQRARIDDLIARYPAFSGYRFED
jgi:hypothetical protein